MKDSSRNSWHHSSTGSPLTRAVEGLLYKGLPFSTQGLYGANPHIHLNMPITDYLKKMHEVIPE